ncbi:hypothetical protein FHS85_005149 [Rhodoligotrophos appendicifer]|uniref:hypothetical protein n=1 Tax=Rhodoligotrophos appendicifer TaxID=987056 RepID=UPI00117F9B06|nr:hypothetical protein [Rhodoligotrophos appendicifer]
MAKTFFVVDRDGWRYQVEDETSDVFDSWILACAAAIDAAKEATEKGSECSVMAQNEQSGWNFIWGSQVSEA